MTLQCPRCQSEILMEGKPPREIVCPSCGSSIQLDPDGTGGWLPEEAPKQLGKFELLEQLGSGSFGTVYKARDTELDRIVAVKIPRAGSIPKQEDLNRFLREARSAAQLKHPGIVTLYDAGHIDATCYLVSEFIQGTTLTQHQSGKRLSFRQAAELIAQVADALQYAHQQGVIHRDIKSSNIMLDLQGRPHLMDFGLAKRAADEITMTLEGQVLGTPAYMSPEQARGEVRKVDARSDIYGLGVILYELLTGELPFRGQTRMLLVQVIQDEPKPPRRLNDKIPRDLETICLKALAKEPSRRYQTASAFADDLKRLLSGEPIQARPVSQVERLWRWSRRNPVIAGLSAAVLLLLLLVAVVGSVGYLRTTLALGREATQRKLAEEAEANMRRLYYAASMNLVQVAWENHNVFQVNDLLAETATFPQPGFEWYYWQRLCRVEHLTLMGHKGGITAVAFAPDGQRLLTGGTDGTARLWDATGGQEVLCLQGHRGQVTAVAFAPDGQRLATGSTDGTARIWDAARGQQLQEFHGQNTGPVWAVSMTSDGKRLITGSQDGAARVWDAASGQELRTLKKHTGAVWAVAVDPNGRLLVTGSSDSTARLWDMESARELLPPLEHTREVISVAWSADSQQLVTGSWYWDRAVKLWDATSGRELRSFGGPGLIRSVTLASDGKLVVAGYHTGTAKVWDAASGQEVLTLMGHGRWVGSVALSPDGQRLATGSIDGTARVWDMASGRGTQSLKNASEVGCIAVSPDGQLLATGSWEGNTAKLWDIAGGREILTINNTGPVSSVAITPDSKRLITAGSNGSKLWDAASGRELLAFKEGTSTVSSIALTRDGERLLTGSEDGTAKLWDIASGRELLTLKGHTGPLRSVALTPDGQRLATGSNDGTAKLWDATSGQVLRTLKAPIGFVWCLALTADGQRLVTGSSQGIATVWDTASGREVLSLKGHTGEVLSVAVTPDGQRIVTGGEDRTVRLWDAVSGRELLTLKGHTGPVDSIVVTSDGRRVITGSGDGTAKIWEAASPEQTALWTKQDQEATRQLAAWQRPASSAPGFIQDWLVLAPLPLESAESEVEGLDRAQLPGEATLRPRAGERVLISGRDYAWQAHRAEEPILDFNRLVGKPTRHSVAYAGCYVISELERNDPLLQVGSDDQAKIYLNGQEIYRYTRPRSLLALDPIRPAKLRKGTNVLVFKVVNGSGDWECCARFVDSDGNPAEGLRVSLTPEP